MKNIMFVLLVVLTIVLMGSCAPEAVVGGTQAPAQVLGGPTTISVGKAAGI